MLRARTMNTLVLPNGAVLAAVEGDIRGWALNLAALPRETIHQLQEGVTTDICAKEGRILQILSEEKEKLQQISL